MLQIDYCCGGDKPLENACWENGLEVLRVHSLLKQTVAETHDTEHPDWMHASLTELCDRIEQKHHARLKDSLPLLSRLMAEVVALHGEAHEELREVEQHFMTWRDEILTAMAEEERSLFPAIRQYDSEAFTDHSETLTAPLQEMIYRVRFEHADIGEALKKTRSASKNFLAPKDACAKFSQMYQLLRWTEADVRQYVHKEESILFPRVKKRLQG
ncbi:Iron-sulfur cluster repair protein YtfE [Roseimaritima multifibrata]|uniref:Iron-sulfur cluster repair protein YtfE n=2 Tax=Roseimaritima multifibrata TaxID=1930274 RepID=A0A517MJ09_9BACT|nr:Iron-sulfur cluster repair protein YtfE [Roseimaritima multifibrata]